MSEATPRVVRDADVAEGTLVGARAPQGAGAAIEGAGEDDGPFEANSELARFLAWWKTNNAETSAGATDGTVYGTARTSTRSFFVHHLSAVAAGVIHADALTLENAAVSNAFFDTRAANRAVFGAA